MATIWDTVWDGGQTVWDVVFQPSAGGCYDLFPSCGVPEYDEYPCEDVVCRRPPPPINAVTCAVPCIMVPCQMIPCNEVCRTGGPVGEVGTSTPCLFVPCLATPCSA